MFAKYVMPCPILASTINLASKRSQHTFPQYLPYGPQSFHHLTRSHPLVKTYGTLISSANSEDLLILDGLQGKKVWYHCIPYIPQIACILLINVWKKVIY